MKKNLLSISRLTLATAIYAACAPAFAISASGSITQSGGVRSTLPITVGNTNPTTGPITVTEPVILPSTGPVITVTSQQLSKPEPIGNFEVTLLPNLDQQMILAGKGAEANSLPSFNTNTTPSAATYAALTPSAGSADGEENFGRPGAEVFANQWLADKQLFPQ